MSPILFLLACTGVDAADSAVDSGLAATDSADTSGDSADSAEIETPVVAFLSPADGATMAAGTVNASVLVQNFLLVDPAKHSDGAPEGHLEVSWASGASTESMLFGTTTVSLPIPTAGTYTLTANLLYEDGDVITGAFPEFKPASISITVE